MDKDAFWRRIILPSLFKRETLKSLFIYLFIFKKIISELNFMQVYGVLDVQRVAGNFHISVHGLNIYVAQMVSSLLFPPSFCIISFVLCNV